ncbi:MAG TPA: hypothetical protein PLV92_28695, partial [Pirellulaceae bacterium]|nr:hypothetical protein [Pirellulaceae bacterium]
LGDSPLSALRSLTTCCPEAFSTAPFAAVLRRRAPTSRLRPVDQWMRVLFGPGRYGDDSHHVRSTRQRSVRLVRQPDSTCHVEFFDSCADAHRLENSGVIVPGLAPFEAAQLVVRALEGRPMSEIGPSGGAWR